MFVYHDGVVSRMGCVCLTRLGVDRRGRISGMIDGEICEKWLLLVLRGRVLLLSKNWYTRSYTLGCTKSDSGKCTKSESFVEVRGIGVIHTGRSVQNQIHSTIHNQIHATKYTE